MTTPSPFKWRHFEPEIILCGVRWYLRYALSYRDVEELMLDRGMSDDHTTGFRWVQRYAPEIDQRSRLHLKTTNDSYRVDETYVKIKKFGTTPTEPWILRATHSISCSVQGAIPKRLSQDINKVT
jgi:transposase-like protein